MTDKRIKEGCPFCGVSACNIQITMYQKQIGKIYCPDCGVKFEGQYGKQTLINKWNNRFL